MGNTCLFFISVAATPGRHTDTQTQKLNVIKCMFSLLSRYVIRKHHVISQETSITFHLEKLTPKNVHNISNTKIKGHSVALTDAFAVFIEGECSMPSVQVNANNRTLAET